MVCLRLSLSSGEGGPEYWLHKYLAVEENDDHVIFLGLDVAVKSVSICVVEADGTVIARGEVSSDPDQIAAFLFRHAPDAERVVHESGILSIWLTRELEDRGLPIICIDARLAHKALSGRLNKSDRGDAEGLAHLARTGWFTQVHIRSEASQRIRVLIGTRERLIKMRKDLEGHVRGVLKVFGVCMSGVHRAKMRQGFRDQLLTAGAVDPAISVMVGMFTPIPLALCSAADAMGVGLRAIARGSSLALRLMTVPPSRTCTHVLLGSGRRAYRRSGLHLNTG